MKTRTVQRIGWVLKHPKKGVWKEVYDSKPAAEAEFNSQVAMIRKTYPTYDGAPWTIESIEYYTQVDPKHEGEFKEFEGV